ncbi:hypothetical protein CKO28_01560 [Rhodovibrio sodomensis]|uniref:Cyclic-phosphate processing Receiver domain-containing protein n=1 Tax=Rhodovibrio sodomensis TaxID=1088 RepID=A0ABS1D8J9_9PROT|nr:cyclic-phosphate processing receiver domain-containing protein [Rhodovibrio sodomensis]MBK1666732.1 hypothetical protein [Rhodovibrio sodomensis]
MTAPLKIWLDDVRRPPEGWTWAQTHEEAIDLLEGREVTAISLDHDLGDQAPDGRERTGYDVLLHIVQRFMDDLPVPQEVYVHSANPVGVARMEGVIARYLAPAGIRTNTTP